MNRLPVPGFFAIPIALLAGTGLGIGPMAWLKPPAHARAVNHCAAGADLAAANRGAGREQSLKKEGHQLSRDTAVAAAVGVPATPPAGAAYRAPPTPPYAPSPTRAALAPPLEPAPGLKRIEELRARGKLKGARKELLRFRKHYPNVGLPQPLAALAATPAE